MNIIKLKIEIAGYSKDSLEKFNFCCEVVLEKYFKEKDEFIDLASEIDSSVNAIEENEPNQDQRNFFNEHCLSNKNFLLVIDQINRKYGYELTELTDRCFIFVLKIEFDKIIFFLNKIDLVEKTEGEIFVHLKRLW